MKNRAETLGVVRETSCLNAHEIGAVTSCGNVDDQGVWVLPARFSGEAKSGGHTSGTDAGLIALEAFETIIDFVSE